MKLEVAIVFENHIIMCVSKFTFNDDKFKLKIQNEENHIFIGTIRRQSLKNLLNEL